VYCLELAGEDDAFAAREAAAVATDCALAAPGVAVAEGLRVERVRTLAYTHAASEFLGRTDADIDAARSLLSETLAAGDGPTPDDGATVAVRARNVRGEADISTSEAERELGGALVDAGFGVDLEAPDHTLRVVFAGDACFLGWLLAESERDFGPRAPTKRPFFQPGSMAPLDARALANIAGAAPDARVLDPMCGTGGVLIEAGLVGSSVLGTDAQWKMVRGTLANLREYLGDDADAPTFHVARGDATRLPLRDDAVDGVVFDAPYGRQSKVARHDLVDLVGGALAEAHRLAPRAVVMGDRSWREAAEAAGWTVDSVFERPVHGSLTRYVHVLDRE
jgi:tRNA (guanine10-N2)-dimethyltransferase